MKLEKLIKLYNLMFNVGDRIEEREIVFWVNEFRCWMLWVLISLWVVVE